MVSGFPARVQDELHFHFMEPEFEPHRIFMRIHEPLYAGVEHANLGLRPLPDFDQGRLLIDEFTVPKYGYQQIVKCRFGREMLAARCVQRINNRKGFRRTQLNVIDRIADKLPV